MSMLRTLVAARDEESRVDVGLITGQQLRGRVTEVSDGDLSFDDCATILLQPAPNDTPFALAVPHILYVRLVDDSNRVQQPPRTIQGRM